MSDTTQVVMITGAAGALGRAVATAFMAHGAKLALLGRDVDSLRRALPQEGEGHLLLAADLMDAQAVEQAARQAWGHYGRIDALCHIAGGFRMGEAVHETTAQTWDLMLDLNARSVIHVARAVVPLMQRARRGSIIHVGAASAGRGVARMGAYAASKSAVERLTESMSAELRDEGINVNAVLPGVIDTPANRADMPQSDPSRWVAPADLAEVIVFLASARARAIHGACIPVTGLG